MFSSKLFLTNLRWWYNAPKLWLGRRGMSQFSDRNFFGHQVCLRPDDWLRKRFFMPKLHFAFVPYFSGSDISFSLCIKPNEGKKPDTLKYTWYLSARGDKEPFKSDSDVAVISDKEYETKLFLGHFSFTNEYKLDLKVTRANTQQFDTVADFEVTSRAIVEKNFWWIILSLVIGVIIGKLT